MEAHYRGDPLEGAALAHEFTHCGTRWLIYRSADKKHVRVLMDLVAPKYAGDPLWALDCVADEHGYLRATRVQPGPGWSDESVLGIVGRLQGELYDGRSGAVYSVTGPQQAAPSKTEVA